MPTKIETLQRNIDGIRERIAQAANRAGRDASEITMVAVTKYVDVATTEMLVQLGCRNLGESRPQQLWSKFESVEYESNRPHWHLIGHLQRNKVKRTLPTVDLIHSVDSLRLLSEIDTQCSVLKSKCSVLLEVNVSNDREKHGFIPGELRDLLPQLLQTMNVKIVGLMAMSSRDADESQAGREFGALRELRDTLQHDQPEAGGLNELSMGMSGDFEAAIAEGSTLVRIGSALYEGL